LAQAGPILSNGNFESGNGETVDEWICSSSVPPVRSDKEAHSRKFSLRSTIKNEGAVPREGHLIQSVESGIIGGKAYELTFWPKQNDFGVSNVQQYMV